jgi:hypothetical protein
VSNPAQNRALNPAMVDVATVSRTLDTFACLNCNPAVWAKD